MLHPPRLCLYIPALVIAGPSFARLIGDNPSYTSHLVGNIQPSDPQEQRHYQFPSL